MSQESAQPGPREYDFALIVSGVPELSDAVQDALYESGCDDATLSIQYGLLYAEFSRSAPSIKDAIVSAILDVRRSGLPARVLRVDDSNLVTQADIARRIGRSRQLIHQYVTGHRGPGGFPPPACHLSAQTPLWTWSAVSHWLADNGLLRPEESRDAVVVEAINTVLERDQLPADLLQEITRDLAA
jgi:hypothetical protein